MNKSYKTPEKNNKFRDFHNTCNIQCMIFFLYIYILNHAWRDGFLLPTAEETEVAACAKEFLKIRLGNVSRHHIGTGTISCTQACFVSTELAFVVRKASVIVVGFLAKYFPC
jgi:hypothetical protein